MNGKLDLAILQSGSQETMLTTEPKKKTVEHDTFFCIK